MYTFNECLFDHRFGVVVSFAVAAPLYLSSPWQEVADAEVADLIYVDKAVDITDVASTFELNMYQETPVREVVCTTDQFKPAPGRMIAAGEKLGLDLTAYTLVVN